MLRGEAAVGYRREIRGFGQVSSTRPGVRREVWARTQCVREHGAYWQNAPSGRGCSSVYAASLQPWGARPFYVFAIMGIRRHNEAAQDLSCLRL